MRIVRLGFEPTQLRGSRRPKLLWSRFVERTLDQKSGPAILNFIGECQRLFEASDYLPAPCPQTRAGQQAVGLPRSELSSNVGYALWQFWSCIRGRSVIDGSKPTAVSPVRPSLGDEERKVRRADHDMMAAWRSNWRFGIRTGGQAHEGTAERIAHRLASSEDIDLK
jgi:hypothetical protein